MNRFWTSFVVWLACAIGQHVYDPALLERRKRHAARMGVDLREGLPVICERCGEGFWR